MVTEAEGIGRGIGMVTRELAYKGRVREGDIRGFGHWGAETEVVECERGVRSTGGGSCGDHL